MDSNSLLVSQIHLKPNSLYTGPTNHATDNRANGTHIQYPHVQKEGRSSLVYTHIQ